MTKQPVKKEIKETKKGIKAKWISIIAKIAASLIAIGYNVFNVLYNRKIPSLDEQKSILYLCGAIILFFSSIDLSLICRNIFIKGEKE